MYSFFQLFNAVFLVILHGKNSPGIREQRETAASSQGVTPAVLQYRDVSQGQKLYSAVGVAPVTP